MGWRPLSPADLPGLVAIAREVHPAYPERPEVFAERLALDPGGCFAFDRDGVMAGYALSHPWRGAPPRLDSLLRALPADPQAQYIHDIALLPAARGRGATAQIVARLLDAARARRLPRLALVAIGGLAPFWARHGFETRPAPGGACLASYDEGAAYMVRLVAGGGAG